MRTKLVQANLTIHDVAKASGWSHEHFSRQYVRHFGISPREALLRMRVEQAARLLVQEQWPVRIIAESVGFSDSHYFSRAFHRIIGFTASEYRVAFTQPINKHIVHFDDKGASYPLNHYFVFPEV
jgi:transcriptional regulator GlxA family with amidase domain